MSRMKQLLHENAKLIHDNMRQAVALFDVHVWRKPNALLCRHPHERLDIHVFHMNQANH